MKKIRKLLGVLFLICALVVMQLPASEAIAANEASDFSIFEDTVLTKYVGTAATVVIPNGIQTIATDAFKNNTYVKAVVIPKSVKEIQPYAFWGSSITSVTIGAGLKEIGDYAFANCKSLTSVNIPENVERIGIYAFEDNISLTDATITYKTMDIHESAFDGCYKLVIHAPEGSYPYKYAQDFYKRQLEFNEYEDVNNFNPDDNEDGKEDGKEDEEDSSIHFIYNPDGTVSDRTDYSPIISDYEGSLGSVHVVGNQAVVFMDSASPNVYLGSKPPQYDEEGNLVTDSNSGTGSGDGMGGGMLENSIIAKYTIVDDRIVADQAYYCNTGINYVVLPPTVKEIGQFAFARSSLTSIVLPNGLERISYGAFYHCDNLSSVTIPDSVLFVEPNAFVHTTWMDNFLGDSEEEDYLISGGVLVAYKGNNTNVEIPDGVRSIAAEVFKNHTEITSVVLPKSVMVIGEDVFAGCSNLNSINLDESSVKYILDRAFKDTAIDKMVLPSALAGLGINAFDDDVVLFYLGSEPETTHENTAERLSNSALRAEAYLSDEIELVLVDKPVGVTVVGVDSDDNLGIEAYLEAPQDKYVLTVENVSESEILAKALARASEILGSRSLINPSIYELELTDKSGIPITKLGKVGLTIAIPIPEGINSDTRLTVLTVDRNGQLEELKAETVSVEGKRYVRFTTYHLSPFAIYSTGDLLTADEIVVANETISALAAPPVLDTDDMPGGAWNSFVAWFMAKKIRLIIAAGFTIAGMVMLLYHKRKI